MRLALITHKFVKGDGQGRVNYELAKAALAEGHTVFLLANVVAPELARHPLARCVHIGVRVVPTALLQNQLFAARTAWWLHRHRHEVDLVHVNGFVSWSRAHVNSCHFVHAAWLASRFHTWRLRKDAYGLYQLVYSVVGAWLERWSYRRAGSIVAVSEQVRRELITAGSDPTRLCVISNGVDTEEFKPLEVSRETLGLPSGNLMLFIGDIKTPRKNLDTLLRAMVRIPDATLIIAGDIADSPYPRLASALGVEARVRFLGYRNDIALLMRAADVFVFPSRYEACSLVLLEAAASGLPVVAARTTGGAELLTPACSVLLEDCEDAGALAAALRELFADPPRLGRMGAAGRDMALANTWHSMAQRYLHLYQELLAQSQGQSAAGRRVQRVST